MCFWKLGTLQEWMVINLVSSLNINHVWFEDSGPIFSKPRVRMFKWFFVIGSVIKSLCMPESMSLFQHSVSRMLAEKRLHDCRKPVGKSQINVSYCVLFYEDSGNGLLTHYDILGGIRDYKSITLNNRGVLLHFAQPFWVIQNVIMMHGLAKRPLYVYLTRTLKEEETSRLSGSLGHQVWRFVAIEISTLW